MSLKIRNRIKNPTVQFGDLKIGQVYMTLDGDICLKLEHPAYYVGRGQAPSETKLAFSLKHSRHVEAKNLQETVPVYADLVLQANCAEEYDFEDNAEDYEEDEDGDGDDEEQSAGS